jgi:Zinc-binding dehydrogenase
LLLQFISFYTYENYATIEKMVSTGLVTPLIEQFFLLHRGPEALKLVEQGRVRGKVVVKLYTIKGKNRPTS